MLPQWQIIAFFRNVHSFQMAMELTWQFKGQAFSYGLNRGGNFSNFFDKAQIRKT